MRVNDRLRAAQPAHHRASDRVARAVGRMDDLNPMPPDVPRKAREADHHRSETGQALQFRDPGSVRHRRTEIDGPKVHVWDRLQCAVTGRGCVGRPGRARDVHVEAGAVQAAHEQHVDEGVRARMLGGADEEDACFPGHDYRYLQFTPAGVRRGSRTPRPQLRGAVVALLLDVRRATGYHRGTVKRVRPSVMKRPTGPHRDPSPLPACSPPPINRLTHPPLISTQRQQ